MLLPVASPCPARASHCWQPCRPALPARRPALPALSRLAARTALLLTPPVCCPPYCAQPCWLAPCFQRAALLVDAPLPAPPCPRRPAAARAATCRPTDRRLAARALPCYPRTALLAAEPPFPAHAQPCWPPPYPTLAACHSSLVLRRLSLPYALPYVLTFDHEGRPIQFDTWLDDLQQYLLSDSRDRFSLFDHTFGTSLAPPATADSATRSQWPTRDAAARLAICNHLPLAERAHFGQHKTAKALDHFLTLDPTSLTVDLLEQHLLAAETSAVAVGAARGTPRSPFFEGCSPSPLSSSFASAATTDVSVLEDVGAASTSTKRRNSKGKGGRGSGGGSGGGGGGSGHGSGGSGRGGGGAGGGGSGGTGGGGGGSGGGGGGSGQSGGSGGGGTSGGRSGPQRGGRGGGRGQQQQRRSETQTPQHLREWLVQRGVGEGSETCPYVIRTSARAGRTCGRFHTERCCFARLDDAWRTEFGDDVERPRWAELLSAEGDCYWCVPPDPGIADAALGASASGTPLGTAPAEALHTFTLDSGASRCFFHDSTTLTPLSALVPVRLADPSGGPVVASSSTVLPCPAVPSGSLSGLHLPLFSTNLVSTAALQDAMVTTTTPGGQGVSICTCTRTGRHLATFTRRPGLSLYTLATEPPQGRERYFLLVVDDYTRYTTVFPLRSKGEVSAVLIPWIRTIRLQLRERFGQDLPILRVRSDRGGEFSSDLLRDLCHGEGILQSFTLLDSPQKNGIAERRIGLVMEVARTSMIHVAAPHFVWPFAVRYAAHQLNLWPRVSLPETSPTLRWTGKVGDASVFRV
ncbi:unnamed protein product, partial [Closterium sp. NIES-53]